MGSRIRDVQGPATGRVCRRTIAMLLGAILLVGVVSGCTDSSSPSQRPDRAHGVDGGSWYVKEQWPHDGKPYETAHFVVYSDGAGLEARQRLASLAEEVYVEVVDEMGVDPGTMFRFPADQDKIDLYANRYNVLEGGGARAYYAGVIIGSFDHEAGREATNVSAVRATLKHELVHVVEALLKGRFVGDVAVDDPRRMPVWFSEGTAEALSGGATAGAPRTLDQIDGLIAEYGRINPIAWRVDLPLSKWVLDAYHHYYYPMAHLAVEYLLDPQGLGKSPQDLAAVMLDMGNDVSFTEAFENHIGISQSDYETQFFSLMDTYLPESKSPLLAIGLGLLSLLAASLMGGSLIWSFQKWPAVVATTGAIAAAESDRRRRRGFVVEISVLAVIAIGFAALLLYRIAFADLPPYIQRAPGYLTTAAYVVASAAMLMWAVRRWAESSRGAYLIPLFIFVFTGITIVVIEQLF